MPPARNVELITGVSIFLDVYGRIDARRFIAAFQDVWRSLPDYARQLLPVHWGHIDGLVILTNHWKGRGNRLAECTLNGMVFHFLAPAMDRMSDDVVRICIVHELAHAFFFAIGESFHCGSSLPESVRVHLAESIVHEISAIWGFEWRRLGQWCIDNDQWLVPHPR